MDRTQPTVPEARARNAETAYKRIARQLADRIDRGAKRWSPAYSSSRARDPRNIETGDPYLGTDAIVLAAAARRHGWSDNRWAEPEQIETLGASVRKGAQPTPGVQGPHARQVPVFNAEQLEHLPERAGQESAERPPGWETNEAAERFIANLGAKINHFPAGRGVPYYDLPNDTVEMPERAAFPDAPGYYATAFHYLAHWTGHPARMDRPELRRAAGKDIDSADYASEALQAEIFAMMAAERLGVRTDPERHAAYVRDAVARLPGDRNTEIELAARGAQGMLEYALLRARQREAEVPSVQQYRPERIPDQPGMLSPASRAQRREPARTR